MDLQSIRYAEMVSTMTFERAVEVFGQYLVAADKDVSDPWAIILDFFG